MSRPKGSVNKLTKEIKEKLQVVIEDTIDSIDISKLEQREKLKLIQIGLQYIIPRLRHVSDESTIPEQPLFVENTMVVSDSKYNEMKENGRIDDEGNLIKE